LSLSARRWLVVSAGILANICMGAGYAFSVFKAGLIEALHCTPQQLMMAYSLSFAFLPVGMLVGGVLSRRFTPRVAVVVGGILFGLGVTTAGLVHSVYLLWLSYGAMVSVGNGIAYAVIIAVAVRWFPDKKGLASGMVVAALGVGTVVIAIVGQKLASELGAQGALRCLGAAFLVISLIASRFIQDPPKDYVPAGWTPPTAQDKAESGDVAWGRMLAMPVFWMLFLAYVCGATPGLMVIGEAKDVAVDVTKLGALMAASMVGMLGAANSAGRLVWGAISDRMGRLNVLCAIMLLNMTVLALMGHLTRSQPGLILSFVVVGLCFGGILGTFPSLCADRFGSRNMEVNYALLFVAFGSSGMLAKYSPQLKAAVGYDGGFLVCAGIAGLGLLLALGMRLARK